MQVSSKTYCVRGAVLGMGINRPKRWICVALEAYISMLPTTPVHDSRGLPKALGLTCNLFQDLITKSCIKQLRKYIFCFAAVVDLPFNFQGPCLLVKRHTKKLRLTARLGLSFRADFWAQLYNEAHTHTWDSKTQHNLTFGKGDS